MLTIGQVASRTGLRASAIRYYEAQGLLPRPSRQAGKRMYSAAILDRLAVIELAKIAGFGLSEIRVLLSHVEAGEPSAACTCATLEECGRAYIQARLSQASKRVQPSASQGS